MNHAAELKSFYSMQGVLCWSSMHSADKCAAGEKSPWECQNNSRCAKLAEAGRLVWKQSRVLRAGSGGIGTSSSLVIAATE